MSVHPRLEPLGAGVGLRREHFEDILRDRPPVRWFEVIPENFLERGGYVADRLRRIAQHYRMVAHGVSLSIGSTDPLDGEFLLRLRRFCDEVRSPWYSDHLCFTMVDHVNLNELIPLPFTREAARHVAGRVRQVRDVVERPLLLENVTYYMAVSRSQMSEAQFITEVLEQSDCGLLLDVSNVILNGRNHGFDPYEFVESIPLDRVGQLHLAGFEEHGEILLDTHARPVDGATWALFRHVIARIGPSSPLVEWDVQLPSLARLLQEADLAQRCMDEVCGAPDAAATG
jgi:uncharacterized protein (UPF0276 family)